jgi:hypothetical protein
MTFSDNGSKRKISGPSIVYLVFILSYSSLNVSFVFVIILIVLVVVVDVIYYYYCY